MAAGGTNFLVLRLGSENANPKRTRDLIALAQEALTTNFNGTKVAKYEIAERALADDRAAFEADPKNFAVFLMGMKRFDDSRKYNLLAAAINPDDPDVLYQRGVLDWMVTFDQRMKIQLHSAALLQPLAGTACAELRGASWEQIEEGIAVLSKAVKLRPGFDDAMAYLNLMYRERAGRECDDAVARAADLKNADDWVNKTFITKKANLGKNNAGNVLSLFPLPSPAPLKMVGGIVEGAPARVRVSESVTQGLLLKKVNPVYPPLARQARIQGTVFLRVVIGKDGLIENLTVISGHPILAPSALAAVKQWQYKPYTLNGEPVEVETQVTVNFALVPL